MSSTSAAPRGRLPLPRLLAFSLGSIPAWMMISMLSVYLPPGAPHGPEVYHTHSLDQLSVLVEAATMANQALGAPAMGEPRQRVAEGAHESGARRRLRGQPAKDLLGVPYPTHPG